MAIFPVKLENFKISYKEISKRHILHRILDSGASVIDVGSHKGEFIKAINRKDLIVYSIEPQLDCLAIQKRNLKKYKNISYHNVAIGSRNGASAFYVSLGTDGSSLNRPIQGIASRWATTIKEVSVETLTLESFIKCQEISSIGLLKCDTQGSDLIVMESLHGYFKEDFLGAVLIEISLHNFYVDQSSFADIIAAFEKRNYFLAEIFPVMNSKGWLWYIDALFLPRNSKYVT